jgi:DNA primase
MNLTQQIKDIDLAELVESEGIKLKRGVCCCPLHNDTNPSFHVYQDNHFKCFGCGEYGDAADFIQRLHGLSFKEALQHLGIKQGPVTVEMRNRIKQAKQRREEKEKSQRDISDLVHTLSFLIRNSRKAMNSLTHKNFNDLCEILDPLPWWEHCHDTLIHGTDEEKIQCLEDLKDFPIKQRDKIFKSDFDFSSWLRNFANGSSATH